MNALAQPAFVVFLAIAVSGCGGYAPYSYWGGNDSGYSDTRLAENRWTVLYRGNQLTDPAKVTDFTLLRAAELTVTNGFRYFVVVAAGDGTRSNTVFTPGYGSGISSAKATCFGDSVVSCNAAGTSSYTYVPPSAYQIVRPGLAIQITAFADQPQSVESFDAQFLYKSLKEKWQLK